MWILVFPLFCEWGNRLVEDLAQECPTSKWQGQDRTGPQFFVTLELLVLSHFKKFLFTTLNIKKKKPFILKQF